jgi:hypothetical protein
MEELSTMEHDHTHQPHQDDGEGPEHREHGAYWPPRPLARARASIAIGDLVGNAHGTSVAVDRLRSIPRDLQELDAFVELARRALLGDSEALASARSWLDDRSDPRLTSALPTHPEHGHSAEHGVLEAEPWVHPSALLDLTIGTAFTAAQADRPGALQMVQQRVVDVARPIAVTMTVLADIPPQVTGRERFDAFLDRLGDFSRFDHLRLDLGGCLGELLDLLGRPNGVISKASHTSELEIDDNTGRIGSAAPDPVCTGARLTLTAEPGESFIERSGVTVGFSPCGRLGSDITWTPNAVSVTVPIGAKAGPVYFARPDTAAASTLATTSAIEIAGVLGNCPYLGRGAETSIMVSAVRAPLDNLRCFLPLGLGVAVGVTEAPAIALFRGVAQDGSPITNQSLPGPDDPITLEWEVTAEAGANTDVRLLADGALLAQSLALRGKHAVAKAQATKTYTLVVASSCGVLRRDLIVTVQRILRFDPPDVSVSQGQTATLNLIVDRALPADAAIFLTTLPSHPTAPGSVIMPAGQTQVPVGFPNVQPDRPLGAGLTVIAYAPRHSPATGRVWVTPPLGTHRIVADRTGTQGRAAIDVVGVHAALTSTGSVLLFAYDESPAGYADINTGKSAVWEPGTNRVQSIRMSRNLFCAGHAFLGDGRVLVAGGQSSAITVGGFLGSLLGAGRGADHDVHIFDGAAWSRVLPDMPGARWYPTCTTLPDGRVMIVSGYAAHAYATLNSHYEIVDPSTSSLVKRADFRALLPFNYDFDLYPFLQVLPGRSLFVHSHDTTWLLALNSSNEPEIPSLGFTPYYNAKSPNSRTYPGQGACVLLPLDPATPTKASILVVGGGGGPHGGIDPTTPASNTAEIFEFDSSRALDAQPQWRFTRDAAGNQTFLTNRRLMADAVLLPDGTVAIIGGTGGGKADHAWPPIMWVESFDPSTETFTQRSGIDVPRLYHSTALLLSDGSVMVAGSTGGLWSQAISGGSANEFRIEVYHPPYLFRGPRPALRLPSTSLRYGQPLQIEIPTGAREIKQAALIRHGSTTHSNNMDQRYVGLQITSSTDTHITVALPADGTLAPPGPYMVFVISNDANADPVPSQGVSVMLGP